MKLLERREDWPAELHAAADDYETAMAHVQTLTHKSDDRRREAFIAEIMRVQVARDRFVMLRKRLAVRA